jgi:hypothetical protein
MIGVTGSAQFFAGIDKLRDRDRLRDRALRVCQETCTATTASRYWKYALFRLFFYIRYFAAATYNFRTTLFEQIKKIEPVQKIEQL